MQSYTYYNLKLSEKNILQQKIFQIGYPCLVLTLLILYYTYFFFPLQKQAHFILYVLNFLKKKKHQVNLKE